MGVWAMEAKGLWLRFTQGKDPLSESIQRCRKEERENRVSVGHHGRKGTISTAVTGGSSGVKRLLDREGAHKRMLIDPNTQSNPQGQDAPLGSACPVNI